MVHRFLFFLDFNVLVIDLIANAVSDDPYKLRKNRHSSD